MPDACGEMSEGLKEHAWKACVGVILLPWVRIPLSPPLSLRSSGCASGLQALRRFAAPGSNPGFSGHFRFAQVAARVGFRRSAALRLRARIPAFPATFASLKWLREWASGAPPLCGSGLESRLFRPLSLRSSGCASGLQALRRFAAPGSNPGFSGHFRFAQVAARVGFRRSAALRLRARIPAFPATFASLKWLREWASGAPPLCGSGLESRLFRPWADGCEGPRLPCRLDRTPRGGVH